MSLRIVLFEDTSEFRDKILEALKRELAGSGEAFEVDLAAQSEWQGVYQDRIEMALAREPYAGATLVVADYDLSTAQSYPGLSEQQVRAAADRLAIPVCGYARGWSDSGKDFVRLAKEREASIVLNYGAGNYSELARQAVGVARGFADIAGQLPARLRELKRTTPGALMAQILGKPEYADKIALYASGDQDRLVSMKKDDGENDAHYHARLSCSLGYWLWDSILRYPGVLVNRTASSSYLNIHENDFQQNDIQELFAKAQYGGPFASSERPQWWRGVLDDIVAENNSSDGREFAASRLGREVHQSECIEEPGIPAGYYCMLSGRPVSLKNSKGGLPWFPRGADLARVSKSKMDELGPWL
jgi:hypothetical protein